MDNDIKTSKSTVDENVGLHWIFLRMFQIDYKVTWKKLKDVFKLAGNVQRVEVMQSKDGKSRGMATVSFDTQLEALQAICILRAQKTLKFISY